MDAHILVVDDEAGVREMVGDALRFAGYRVTVAADAVAALSTLHKSPVDLMIADVNMQGMDGYELLKRLRDSGDSTPTILLTARHESEDITHGLRTGADDYVTKPFRLEELLLRVEAVIRRTRPSQPAPLLSCGPVTLDPETHTVTRNGRPVDLSPTEFRLLEVLMRRQGKIVTRKALLADVWEMDFAENASVVDTYIFYLRKKLHS
ncbi:MAG: response regulator transcription factor, partial [Candidatus Nanopelagicales bacterium]